MKINVHLHGILREQLPPQAKGRAAISLPDGAAVDDLLAQLNIAWRVVVAVNDEVEVDKTHPLTHGDNVAVFTMVSGG